MDTFIIIVLLLAITSGIIMFVSIKNAEEIDELPQEPKFQPRKITFVPGEEAPKKKKKRYYNSKKKPAVANNAPTEKRSVGRPKKSN